MASGLEDNAIITKMCSTDLWINRVRVRVRDFFLCLWTNGMHTSAFVPSFLFPALRKQRQQGYVQAGSLSLFISFQVLLTCWRQVLERCALLNTECHYTFFLLHYITELYTEALWGVGCYRATIIHTASSGAQIDWAKRFQSDVKVDKGETGLIYLCVPMTHDSSHLQKKTKSFLWNKDEWYVCDILQYLSQESSQHETPSTVKTLTHVGCVLTATLKSALSCSSWGTFSPAELIWYLKQHFVPKSGAVVKTTNHMHLCESAIRSRAGTCFITSSACLSFPDLCMTFSKVNFKCKTIPFNQKSFFPAVVQVLTCEALPQKHTCRYSDKVSSGSTETRRSLLLVAVFFSFF